jgi:hypothetical protein
VARAGAHGEGLVDFALLPRDIAATVAAARSRGLAGLPDRPADARAPDGVRIEWQSARPSTSDLPFLCFDVTPRALRVPEGEVRRHANGALGIPEVTVSVGDLPATLERYRALPRAAGRGRRAGAAGGARILLREEPRRARGEGPCACDCASRTQAAAKAASSRSTYFFFAEASAKLPSKLLRASR